MNRLLRLILLLSLLIRAGLPQDTTDQLIKDYESKLANPNLPADLRPLIQARIDRLKQIKSLDLQIASAKSLKSELKDLTPEEIKKIDDSVRALEQKKAALMPSLTQTSNPSAQSGSIPQAPPAHAAEQSAAPVAAVPPAPGGSLAGTTTNQGTQLSPDALS